MAGREGGHEQLESQEDLETEEEIEDVNPFHEVGPANRAARSGLEERLLHALDLNGGGVKIEVLFVKLKLKGTALQWWKRVEEQRAQQGKLKIGTWQHMKTKLWKQFLPADYTMELYEGLHCLKQNNMSVEEYFAEFNNLPIPVGLSKSNEQITSHYLAGLNQSIRDEMGVVCLYNIEDAQQYTLAAEKRVSGYGARKPIYRTNWQNNLGPRRGYQTGQREWKETTTTNKTNRAKGGNNFQVRCFTCGEKGHTSFACPQRRVNLVEFEEELELVFDEHDEEIEEIDVHAAESNLDNEALCDIVPMDVGHILVGRPWLFDHDMDHKTKPNTYSFYKDNKRYTLYHLKEKAKQLATKSSTTSKTTRYLSVEKFNAEHGEMGIMYALINKIVESDQVRVALKASNAAYSFSANQYHRMQEFEEGDQVLVHLRQERFPKGTYHKLKSKKFGPCKVLRKISSNAYLVELPPEIQINLVFNLSNLFPFYGFDGVPSSIEAQIQQLLVAKADVIEEVLDVKEIRSRRDNPYSDSW
ncbi:hypothetical protein Patl1_36917 [Pistacia atlantica]|nr:hypothetical protein Patl1_36917 [Pistacia atlantica]